MSQRITEWRHDDVDGQVLLGLTTAGATLDIRTEPGLVRGAIDLLDSKAAGVDHVLLGWFGEHEIALNWLADGQVSIFVDGPVLGEGLVQSMGMFVDREELRGVLGRVVGA